MASKTTRAAKATAKPAGKGRATKPLVLVKEKIAQSGIDLLKKEFRVDVKTDMDQAQLKKEIGKYHGIIIRSATKMTADIIEAAKELRVIGRAGIGVDNVDIKAATKKGIIVANAPQSNIVAAAEHTIGLLLAQSRNIPQADASLKAGLWERSKFGGVELADKVLGVIGLGRIGVLVAQRAKGLRMKVVAFDPYVSKARFEELGIEGVDKIDDLYKSADFITVHLPKSPETVGFVGDAAFRKMKKGVRVVNCARGGIIDEAALLKALKSGKVAGAAIDVFVKEPPAGNPLLDFDNVIATPHLGASTIEAQDRAGTIIAEQVAAALNNQFVSNAVNIAPVSPEDMNVMRPFLPLCEQLGRLLVEIADGPLEKFDITYQGALAQYDTRILTVAIFKGALEGRVEETVNYVNAEGIAEDRGIKVTESRPPPGAWTSPISSRSASKIVAASSGRRHDDRAAAPAALRADLPPRHRHRAGEIHGLLPLRGCAGHDRQGGHDPGRQPHQHRQHERGPQEEGRQGGHGRHARQAHPRRRTGRDSQAAGIRRRHFHHLPLNRIPPGKSIYLPVPAAFRWGPSHRNSPSFYNGV